VDKWFALQGARPRDDAASHVEALTHHADFRFTTPNRVYALIGSFSGANLAGFHAADGAGYRFLADAIIRLDAINPQVAARMATGFRTWKLYDAPRRAHATVEMGRILASAPLSRDVFEIISRTLGSQS
jgi:aminopeptidase N